MSVYFSTYNINDITSLKSIENYLKWSNDDIKRAYEYIENMKKFQQDLFNKYQTILKSKYHYEIILKKTKSYYDKKISYSIIYKQVYDENNISSINLIDKIFTGKERKQALIFFEEIKSKYPLAKIIKYGIE